MKILYFHQYFSTTSGSAGTRSYEFAKLFVEKGHEVTMVCLNDSRTITNLKKPFKNKKRRGLIKGIDVIEFDLKYSNYKSFLSRIFIFIQYTIEALKIVFTENCDLIFATSTPLTVSIPGIVSKWVKGTPFVFEVRDLWPEIPKSMGIIRNPIILFLLSFLEWISYQTADLCIGLSPGICDGIRKKGIIPSRIEYLSNACDLDLFKPKRLTNKKSVINTELKRLLDDESFFAAFTGAHGEANGLDYLIEVAINLKRRNINNIKILFIGEGKIKPNLQKKVKDLALDNCYFIDSLPKKELADLLSKKISCGLMILKNIPAFYEGTCPNKFFDYIASGLPVLINYPGWLANIIEKNNLGFYVKPDNPRIFADKLIELSHNPNLCDQMGKKSRFIAETSFSRRKISLKCFHLIEKIEKEYRYRKGFLQIKKLLNN